MPEFSYRLQKLFLTTVFARELLIDSLRNPGARDIPKIAVSLAESVIEELRLREWHSSETPRKDTP